MQDVVFYICQLFNVLVDSRHCVLIYGSDAF